MSEAPVKPERLAAAAAELIANTRELAALGWTPATSSNFSMRLDERTAAITVSGRDKGKLVADDIMVVDFNGHAVGSNKRPSAETVLHTHSLAQSLASKLYAGAGHIRFEEYELIKAFRGQETHEAVMDVPVLANNQHIPTLAAQVDVLLDQKAFWGYLIEGHGLYAWGRDMAEARRHLDAFEFLINCELEMRKLHR